MFIHGVLYPLGHLRRQALISRALLLHMRLKDRIPHPPLHMRLQDLIRMRPMREEVLIPIRLRSLTPLCMHVCL